MLHFFIAQGQSMVPAVPHQALLLVRPCRREPQPGEIVVYQHPVRQFPVVHRLRQKVSAGWLLSGDANPVVDPAPVPDSAIYGRVCLILPRVGRLLKILQAGIGPWKR